MKITNVHDTARKEMANEKARIMRRKNKGNPLLERAALAWKNKEEEKNRAEQERMVQGEQKTPGISVQKISVQTDTLHNKTDDAMQWKQYKLQAEEGKTKGLNEAAKTKVLNSASVGYLARKLMAREWARALGRKIIEDPQALALEREAVEHRKEKEEEKRKEEKRREEQERERLALEREAAEYRKEKEEEKRREEQERERALKQREMLQDSLETFGKKYLEDKRSITPERAAQLFEEALESVGRVVEVSWKEDGCEACIEPWEEKKLRRKSQDSSPVIYKVNINKLQKIDFYERIEQGEY